MFIVIIKSFDVLNLLSEYKFTKNPLFERKSLKSNNIIMLYFSKMVSHNELYVE